MLSSSNRKCQKITRAVVRDCISTLTRGWQAPKYAERIWVDPSKVHYAMKIDDPWCSGKVEPKWPPPNIAFMCDVEECPGIKESLLHFRDGYSWTDCGEYQRLLNTLYKSGKVAGGCRSEADIARRLELLDGICESLAARGGCPTQDELHREGAINRKTYREEGSPRIHIGPDGEPYYGLGGNHRWAMFLALGFDCVPAQIGVVFKDALPYLASYRCPTQWFAPYRG